MIIAAFDGNWFASTALLPLVSIGIAYLVLKLLVVKDPARLAIESGAVLLYAAFVFAQCGWKAKEFLTSSNAIGPIIGVVAFAMTLGAIVSYTFALMFQCRAQHYADKGKWFNEDDEKQFKSSIAGASFIFGALAIIASVVVAMYL